MAKELGRLMLVKMENPTTAGTFATLCGLTSKTMRINNTEVDVTTSDCDQPGSALWTEVLSGVKRITVSGNGLIENSQTETWALNLGMAANSIAKFQVIVPGLGTFEGAFHLADFEYGGEDQSGGVTYAVTLNSSGVITFTAA